MPEPSAHQGPLVSPMRGRVCFSVTALVLPVTSHCLGLAEVVAASRRALAVSVAGVQFVAPACGHVDCRPWAVPLCCRAAWIDKCRPNLLITESTYATTIRDSKRCRERDFLKKVHETVERGGKVPGPRQGVGWAPEGALLSFGKKSCPDPLRGTYLSRVRSQRRAGQNVLWGHGG